MVIGIQGHIGCIEDGTRSCLEHLEGYVVMALKLRIIRFYTEDRAYNLEDSRNYDTLLRYIKEKIKTYMRTEEFLRDCRKSRAYASRSGKSNLLERDISTYYVVRTYPARDNEYRRKKIRRSIPSDQK